MVPLAGFATAVERFLFPPIEPFHMTSRQQYWGTKQIHGGHVGVPKNSVKIKLSSHVKTSFC